MPFKVSASEISPSNIVEKVNAIRTSRGLSELSYNQTLSQAANNKSLDMVSRDYFEHYAYGLSPWDFIKRSGYDYQYAGENLAMDFQTTEGMVNAWMRSPAHRQNILNANYQDIGIGIVKGAYTDENGRTKETIMVTQMFGKKQTSLMESASRLISKIFSF
jgi:uncharacterized protein YkwD